MSVAYALTMLISAFLLFLVEPMFARMALPILGGSPAVWNTAVVFYQVALLAGYGYAHVAAGWLGARRQAGLHALLLLLPLLALPLGIPSGWMPPGDRSPIPWLLVVMLLRVGPPFLILSATSPLLQRWLASTTHPAAQDPYFLYAMSNVGSLAALLAYPFLIEPRLGLGLQSRLWTGGYLLFAVLMLASAALLWRSPRPVEKAHPAERSSPSTETLTAWRRLRWVFLGLVPSSLMLSVTTHLSTNIAAVPLLWVVPLAIYLLTFVLVFARRPLMPHRLVLRALPFAAILIAILLGSRVALRILALAPLHLVFLFIAGMACHGELAADRPSAERLTEFYLWMSLGGALGGAFNALLAPVLFNTVVEYPLGLALTALALWRPGQGGERPHDRRLDVALPAGLAALVAGLAVGLRRAGMEWPPAILALVFVLPALLCFSFSRRPLRFALGLGAIVLCGGLFFRQDVLYLERSFFGINAVVLDTAGQTHKLVHGDTLHGGQSLDPARRCEPTAYYSRTGPIGQVFSALSADLGQGRVAVAGLGAGVLAAHFQPGQEWTFYEIDPAVERIARDRRWFTFLSDCAPDAAVVLGDARLSLSAVADGQYDLIILDAYSSDSVPVHLVTREALALYLAKLAPDGRLAFHTSNRYLDLSPVLASLAHDAGLVALRQRDRTTEAERRAGALPSEWVVMARRSDDLGSLAGDPRWQTLEMRPGDPLWTDDFSSIFGILRWR